MNRLFLLAALSGLFLLHAAAPSGTQIAGHVETARKAWEVPGVALAIVHSDKVTYLAGHGTRDTSKNTPVTEHTLFQIASTSKAFTTTAMAMLIDEGKMKWDDPVRKHLDFFRLADPHADALVTLRDLVSHRTGLPRHDTLWVRTQFPREDLIRRMAFARPSEPFRSLYQYNNLMFLSAGEAVGKTSGIGWDAFLQKRIFGPIGFTDTKTAFAEISASNNIALPHSKREGKIGAGQLANYDNIGGAGCIASSASDLAQWLRLQLGQGIHNGKRLVSAATLGETHLPQTVIRMTEATKNLQPEFTQSTYGLGWWVNHYRGEMLIMHSGSLSGYRALVTLVPRLNLGFVILANLNSTNLPEALTNTLLDEYLDLPKTRDWNTHMLGVVKSSADKAEAAKREQEAARLKDTKPSLPLLAYVGLYTEPAYGEARVVYAEGKLFVEWARFRSALEHVNLNTFQPIEKTFPETSVSFHFDARGKTTGIKFLEQDFARIPDRPNQ
jgi:CubicO group peptidase (beta-lactamase class C family)